MKAKTEKSNRSVQNSRTNNNYIGDTGFFAAQPKLKVGKPGDEYEHEADRVAEEVVNSTSETSTFFSPAQPLGIQAKPLAQNITPFVQKYEEEEEAQAKFEIQRQEEEEEEAQTKLEIQRQEEEEEELVQAQPMEEEEEELQAKSQNDSNPRHTTENLLQNSKGGGSSMDQATRAQMESGFGADFSNVRIHTDNTAVQMNKEMGAQAFTTGNDIYFNNGKYSPDSQNGKTLLAHELTHTIQQGASGTQLLVQRSTASQSLSQIEDAARGWGTDEEGIFRAIRECTELSTLRSNTRVREILNDELSGYDLFKANLLLKYGAESNFPPGILTIWQATDGAGTNEELVYDAIRSSSDRPRLQRSTWVQRTLRDEMSGHEYAKTQLLFRYGTESSYPSYINPLWRATVGSGTDETLLFNTMVALPASDLTNLATHSTFVNVIRDDLSGADLERFNRIINQDGPAIRENDPYHSDYGATETGPVATIGSDPVDTHAFSPNDVTQGAVGDCFFLSSLIAVARRNPTALERMISPQSDGSYNIRFYVRDGDNFRSQIVNVTASFPRSSSGTGGHIYAHQGDSDASGQELWVRLLEKAYAKLRGSYDEIHGGFSSDALETIMGQESEVFRVPFNTTSNLVLRIRNAFRNNHPVTAATYNDPLFTANLATRANEIVSGHAYAVMDVTDDTITLRNPHGEGIGGLAQRVLPWSFFRRYFWRITTLRVR